LLRIEHKFLTIQKFLDIVKYEYYTNDINKNKLILIIRY